MTEYVRTQRPSIDETVWRPTIPLVVMEYCPSPFHLAVWLSIRWLMAAFPQRKGFGRREIAKRARASQGRVLGYIEELIRLELIEVVGEEQVRNLAPRPIYSIATHKLERISCDMALTVLASWGVRTPPPPLPPEQLHFDLNASSGLDRVQRNASDQLSGSHGVQKASPDLWTPCDPPGSDRVQTSGLDRVHLKEINKENQDRETNDRATETPAAPPGQRSVPMSAWQLWTRVNAAATDLDRIQLANYAAEHDRFTDGYGWYWVVRAILAALDAKRPLDVIYIKSILGSWQQRVSYGSDAPGQQRTTKQRRAPAPHTPTPSPAPAPPPSEASPQSGDGGVWPQVLAQLARAIPAGEFTTYVESSTLLLLDSELAVVGAPHVFARDKLQTYRELIIATLGDVTGTVRAVEFAIGADP